MLKVKSSRFQVLLLVAVLALVAGCGTTPNKLDRALFDIQTNYVPVIHLFTNTVPVTNTVTITNTVKEIVEKAVVIHVTNDVGTVNLTTNISITTNVTVNIVATNVPSTTTTVSSETNLVAHDVVVKPKAGVESGVNIIATTAGNAAGGWGGLLGGAAVGLLGLIARQRQRAINKGLQSDLDEGDDINALLAQSIEVGRELMKSTPQGQTVEAKYRTWLKENQSANGVIGAVTDIVETHVDNQAAKAVASMLSPNSPPAAPAPTAAT